MILSEKLFQKLNNLKSKGEIKEFFINYDEYRLLNISIANNTISHPNNSNSFEECSSGKFIIVWDSTSYSFGSVSSHDVENFEEFIANARHTKLEIKSHIYIPNRDIYPIAIAYHKPLADLVDIPEYLLKIADIAIELDQMVKSKKGTTKIRVQDGVHYGYSSDQMDESYPYTKNIITKTFDGIFEWSIKSAELLSIQKIHEAFTFFGDTYNALKQKSVAPSFSKDLILSPEIFEKLVMEQIVENLKYDNLRYGNSIFTLEQFQSRAKELGTLSISYDPLIPNKLGTYKFSELGVKPTKQYFVKFGKLDTFITDNFNYDHAGHKKPTVAIEDFSNLKVEGFKRHFFANLLTDKKTNYSFYINAKQIEALSPIEHQIEFMPGVNLGKNKLTKIEQATVKINLIDIIKENRLELVEFVDGQLGCIIRGIL